MKKIFFIAAFATISSTTLFAQNTGIGTTTPANKLSVNGNAAVGTGYTSTAAPSDGAIIQGNTGIGTTTPAAKLEVKGNMILGTATNYTGNNAATLVRDNSTGEIMAMGAPSGNSKPISYLTYTFSNVDTTVRIDSFDTKISANVYTVALIEASFINPNGTTRLITSLQNASGDTYNPLECVAYVGSGNTWWLKANYSTAKAHGDSGYYHGTWTLKCLVMNNALVKTVPIITKNMGGLIDGSLSAPPAGL